MAPLNEQFQRVITEQRLGFVASVGADGTPNLSPKGTFIVLDEQTIAFGEIRSPNTLRNIDHNPVVEVNFVDPFARKGVRIKGRAEVVDSESDGFAVLLPMFEEIWGPLADHINCIVQIHVERAQPLTSPAYDIGASEAELRALWAKNFMALQPGGRFPSEA